MRKFKQMTHNDRIKMEALLNAGHSKAEVAEQLHFHRSNIYREYDKGKYIHRNSDYTEEERYSSDLGQKAHDYAQEGKGRALKIGNDRELAEYIESKIVDDKFSPEAALAEVKRSGIEFKTTISVRTLYRYIDNGIFLKLTNKDLPIKSKKKKHNKKVKVQKRASAGESIENRPEEVKNREVFGHWEMDTVKGQRGVTKSCMLVLTERKTRDEIVVKLKDQTAASVVEALDRLERKWGDMFSSIFRSITVDNGVEFADYEGMEKSVLNNGEKRTFVFYCHPYSSWERGTNENNNRLIRRHIPKGVDFDDRTDEEIAFIEEWINNYPRGIFEYRTSAELFEEEIQKLA
ncbi:IS30 family transposase [Petralouisia muris]|uniref:IS30 family transposase n=1 Tax=Petralouisia muris TaxID=3032872 RepID=A0AC61RS48_9FIRM|nr:IS30 family transposase [Petralouisia muris]TGY93461.1 IS30 family transposase [Petralouisia muris]